VQSLTVWTFQGADAAERSLPRLERLAAANALEVEDAAIVSCTAAGRAPAIRTVGTMTGPGRLWSGFWGMFLALVFLVPVAGPSLGAAAGAFAGGLSAFGVEDDFVLRVREAVTPGTSALFVLCPGSSADRLRAELPEPDVALIRSDLSPEQQRRLSDVLGDVPEHPLS
jgi:uncharacterized membrane protein